jgi:hypothetical protein
MLDDLESSADTFLLVISMHRLTICVGSKPKTMNVKPLTWSPFHSAMSPIGRVHQKRCFLDVKVKRWLNRFLDRGPSKQREC